MKENCEKWYRDYRFTVWTYEIIVVIFAFSMQNYTLIVKTAVHVVKFKKTLSFVLWICEVWWGGLRWHRDYSFAVRTYKPIVVIFVFRMLYYTCIA